MGASVRLHKNILKIDPSYLFGDIIRPISSYIVKIYIFFFGGLFILLVIFC